MICARIIHVLIALFYEVQTKHATLKISHKLSVGSSFVILKHSVLVHSLLLP